MKVSGVFFIYTKIISVEGVMNSDEQFSDNADKQMLIQLVNENVI